MRRIARLVFTHWVPQRTAPPIRGLAGKNYLHVSMPCDQIGAAYKKRSFVKSTVIFQAIAKFNLPQ